MPENSPTLDKVEATGTWNLDVPINFFSKATYKTKSGKVVQMPVSVAGEQITGQFQGSPPPQR